MLIKGYDYGPLVAGERLLERAGFWSNHLLATCRFTSGEARPEPEWFGDDGADTDALADVLLDDQAWPSFRIPFHGGHSAVVVYRNLIGDYGIDYLLTQPDWPRKEDLSSFDGDWYGPGLSWRDIVHIAETPDLTAPGVHDTAARLLLLLPLLADDGLPPEARTRVNAALTAIGEPEDSAQDTADHLLRNSRPSARRRGGADSPLSGGSHQHTEPESDESAVLWALNLTRTQSDALADALGSRPLPAPAP
ncbi:hypothetical protein [Kitasatospora paracochleata]|uniref:Uncharacterized protein n=1 Tax=Kitasatospora paracochleata TaxID=58354 RepID=A0ABT1J117_9ACTN|nr:hypothetical protein [Kitasatospora paracochleata]MCP2311120.1 hypothetical protein [Kitasatospora paracochleata]